MGFVHFRMQLLLICYAISDSNFEERALLRNEYMYYYKGRCPC